MKIRAWGYGSQVYLYPNDFRMLKAGPVILFTKDNNPFCEVDWCNRKKQLDPIKKN